MALALGGVALAAIAIHLAFWRAGWAWTAPVVLVPLVAPLAAVSPWISLAFAVAVALAMLTGRAWQGQSLERGGVEAQATRERPGLRTLIGGRRERRRWRDERVREGRLVLGETAAGAVVTVPFGARQGVRAFIPGAPGSGKSVDLALHACAYIGEGQGVVAIDPKRDPGLREAVEHAADEHGRRFLRWAPEGPATYNPLARGNPSEVVDKALSGEEWSEPHYLRQAQRYLNLELQTLGTAGRWPVTLADVVAYLDPERLARVAERVEDPVGERAVSYLEGLSTRQAQELGGVRDRLAVLAESSLGAYLAPRDGAAEIDLLGALESGDVVYFELDADRFPLASQMLGAAIVSDLVALTGEDQGSPLRALVLIDEFAAVAAEEVSRLLSRSRSAGLSVVLATQAFADLTIARPGDASESLRRQVLSHVDYLVAHRQSEPEAAELLGQMTGTKPAWSVARRQDPGVLGSAGWDGGEQLTRRRTREFVRHPDEFKRLRTGEAIVIEPVRGRTGERVRIWRAPTSEGA